MKFLFRHEKPRKYQRELMEDCYNCIRTGKNFLAHAPTGIGKTDAIFSAVLTAVFPGKKIIYLSPKISQHQMALKVLSGISDKHGITIRAVEIVGKKHMCVHPLARKLSGEDFYEICRRLREREECIYYKNWIEGKDADFDSGILSHREIIDIAESHDLCPYEVAMDLLASANVIVGDYYHVFSPRVGKIFLKSLGCGLEDVVLIVDEAHNLPERVRKVLSASLSTRDLERASRESMGLDPDLASEIKSFLSDVLSRFLSSPGSERRIGKEDIEAELNPEVLEDVGVEYLEVSGKTRSYCVKLASFLKAWEQDEGESLRYVRTWLDGETVSIVKKSLDPSSITEKIFSKTFSAVLVSGTLTPVEMYADVLGIKEYVGKEYPSPFPEENRLVLVDPSVTTRYSKRREEEFRRIADKICKIVERVPGNTAVFFPSFDVLRGVLDFFSSERPVLVQREKMSPKEVLELYRTFVSFQDVGAVLMAVAGGSLAEGVDYPGRNLVCVVVVGIPLAEMNMETEALIEYYDRKFGRGWYYGYIYPAITKTLQAAGRCIRSEDDVGAVVLMDERYLWQNYRKALPKDYTYTVTESPEKHIKEFMRSKILRKE